MSMRCNVRLAVGVTLPVLLEALKPFFEANETTFDDSEGLPDFGEVAMVDHDDTVDLAPDGSLFMTIGFYGPGHGIAPDCLTDACTALDHLVATGGAIEYIDHDTSASSEDAIAVVFVGNDDAAKAGARIEYALDQARPWLEGAVSASVLAQIETLARGAVNA